ncbi:MAG: hypothetical protein IT370_13110 [Deltaproteobacteria bacterium]|nr:hypothetical protein [Deltaproteobacteria bacterium]
MTGRIAVLAVLLAGCQLPPGDGSARRDAGDGSVDGAAADAGVPLRVLFVGNSYTYVNDLPAVVRALGAATPGGGVEVDSVTVGGATLADHWNSTGARERIASGGFDAVVLQGQSMEPVSSAASFDQHAALFAGALRDAGARGVWYATWARRDVEAEPGALTRALELRYRMAAAHNGDVVARVGAAWQIALLELPGVELYDPDRSHPSPAGSLLAGCVILQALTGKTPRLPDPPPLGVPAGVAARLCAIAEAGVPCDAGQSLCGGACVDWSPASCGGCGIACSPGDPCRRGVCGCDAGRTGCQEQCVDLGSDAQNCGGCGVRCPAGAVCRDQLCACPSTGRQDITGAELTAREPGCISWDPGSQACATAAHRHCAALGGDLDCFASGLGPPSGHAPSAQAVMCGPGDVRTTSYAALSLLVPACDGTQERYGPSCVTAVHRYCVAAGAISGFGPIESSGDSAQVTCLTSASATVVHTTVATLSGFASRCTPDPVSCGVASWNFCEARGYRAGFGPVEVAGPDADVVCLAP